MNTKELRNKSIEELTAALEENLRERFNLRMRQGMGEAIRPHMYKNVRRLIAQIKTLINEKRQAKQ